MHIILGVLGSIVAIAVALKKLADNGYALGGLNPFLRRPRNHWRDRSEANPIYALGSPMELAGLLMLGVAKRDGDLSGPEKDALLDLYREAFHLSTEQAASLLRASAHLLNQGDALIYNLDKVLAPAKSKMTKEQCESTVAMMEKIAEADGAPSDDQKTLIGDVRDLLLTRFTPKGKWQ